MYGLLVCLPFSWFMSNQGDKVGSGLFCPLPYWIRFRELFVNKCWLKVKYNKVVILLLFQSHITGHTTWHHAKTFSRHFLSSPLLLLNQLQQNHPPHHHVQYQHHQSLLHHHPIPYPHDQVQGWCGVIPSTGACTTNTCRSCSVWVVWDTWQVQETWDWWCRGGGY